MTGNIQWPKATGHKEASQNSLGESPPIPTSQVPDLPCLCLREKKRHFTYKTKITWVTE